MGGKPSKGTKRDRRLKRNRTNTGGGRRKMPGWLAKKIRK